MLKSKFTKYFIGWLVYYENKMVTFYYTCIYILAISLASHTLYLTTMRGKGLVKLAYSCNFLGQLLYLRHEASTLLICTQKKFTPSTPPSRAIVVRVSEIYSSSCTSQQQV